MTLELTLAVVLFCGVGVALGVMGSGGAIFTLPLLVYLVDVPPPSAVGMTMVIVGVTSAVGGYTRYRQGLFHAKAVWFLSAPGVGGAYFGASLTHLVSHPTLMVIFASLMLVVGGTMMRTGPDLAPGARCSWPRCWAIGAGVGVLTGFLGIGGGFLIVPALVLLAGINPKHAIGSSLAIVAINSAAGLVGQLAHLTLDWIVTLAFVAPTLLGMWAGLAVTEHLSMERLRLGFAWAIVVGAVGIAAAIVLG